MPADLGRIGEQVSEDQVLGGKLVLRQPLRGHRFGHDAILL
ncbi:MAG: methyltransferase, partial [Xanthobacteraceae bacterium]